MHWKSTSSIIEALICCFSFDLLYAFIIIRFGQAFLIPLSLLSYLSIRKINNIKINSNEIIQISNYDKPLNAPNNKLLDFQLRDQWIDDQEIINSNNTIKSNILIIKLYIKRLSTRFTVVYSFIKLFGAILFVLNLSTNYLHCNYIDSLKISEIKTCNNINDCHSYCVGYHKHTLYYNKEITDNTCTIGLPNYCLCNNWFTFEFSVILLHLIHFIIQCYFFIRYQYFDPQQNQIMCVQSYMFAGDNLLLFLTNPAICFLSTLEAIVLSISW